MSLPCVTFLGYILLIAIRGAAEVLGEAGEKVLMSLPLSCQLLLSHLLLKSVPMEPIKALALLITCRMTSDLYDFR